MLSAPSVLTVTSVLCEDAYRLSIPSTTTPYSSSATPSCIRELHTLVLSLRRVHAIDTTLWSDAVTQCQRLRRLESRSAISVVSVRPAERSDAGELSFLLSLRVHETSQRLTRSDWVELHRVLVAVGYACPPLGAHAAIVRAEGAARFAGHAAAATPRIYDDVERNTRGQQATYGVDAAAHEGDSELWRRLHPHQCVTVRWMLAREREPCEGGLHARTEGAGLAPLWLWHEGQQVRCSPPRLIPGGVLAQEVGMGKTVETIAVLRLAPPPPSDASEANPSLRAPRDGARLRDAPSATLVVCPVTILGQWASEIQAWGGGALRVVLYHGPRRRAATDEDMAAADVVLTTFETLSRDVGRLPPIELAQRVHCVGEFERARDEARSHWRSLGDLDLGGGGGNYDDDHHREGGGGDDDDAEVRRYAASVTSAYRRSEARLSAAVTAREIVERAFQTTPLLRVRFGRLVVDEAHRAHDPSTMISAALEAVEARARWALTATPLSLTSDNGTHGLAHLLRMEPFRHSAQWAAAASRGGGCAERRALAARFWCSVMWRQTKQAELALPQRHDRVVRLALHASERSKYDAAHAQVTQTLASLGHGRHQHTRMSSLLSALRAIASDATGAPLVQLLQVRHDAWALSDASRDEPARATEDAQQALERLQRQGEAPSESALELLRLLASSGSGSGEEGGAAMIFECPICYEVGGGGEIALTSCSHAFCHACIETTLRGAGRHAKCPTCRAPLSGASAYNLIRPGCARASPEEEGGEGGEEGGEEETNEGAAVGVSTSTRSGESGGHHHEPPGAKVAWVVERAAQAPHKIVVASHFQHTCRALRAALDAAGVGHVGIQGGTPQAQRQRALERFRSDPDVRVFVLTRGAASVGVNLVAASEVVIMEPALSAAIEQQTVGRIHRIGQQSATTVTRLVAEGTVEEGVLQMREGVAQGSGEGHLLLRVV